MPSGGSSDESAATPQNRAAGRLGSSSDPAAGHWFDGKDADVLIYKINRRPLPLGDALFSRPPLMEHLQEVLSVAGAVETGRRFKRIWKVGNKTFDQAKMTGVLGWSRAGESLKNVWNERRQAWEDTLVDDETTVTAPVAVLAEGHLLGVLKHPSFDERVIARVFCDLLRQGEAEREVPVTEWDVEPVGSEGEFFQWLDSLDALSQIRFAFKMPNPSPDSSFDELFARQEELHARLIREEIVAQDATGLNRKELKRDRTARQFIAAAVAAYGFLVGQGVREGHKVSFDQRDRVARERVEQAAPTWDGAKDNVLDALQRWRKRR